MNKVLLFTSIYLLIASAHAAPTAAGHAPAPAAKSAPVAAPKPQMQEVPYDDLVKYLNKRIVVRTTLRTERSGILLKYSGTAIELKLDTGATLGLPRDTIRAIGVPVEAADALFPEKK